MRASYLYMKMTPLWKNTLQNIKELVDYDELKSGLWLQIVKHLYVKRSFKRL